MTKPKTDVKIITEVRPVGVKSTKFIFYYFLFYFLFL